MGPTRGPRLWLRWSARDARRRWAQILVTALVLAIGTGTFAGLGGTTVWRERSNDRSYALLNGHDVRLDLAEGSFAAAGQLASATDALRARGLVAQAEERLIVPTQVDASRRGGATVLVRGQLVGIPLDGAPRVDKLAALDGRALRPADARRRVAVLDRAFAHEYELPPAGRARLAGIGPVRYVGAGVTPQWFVIAQDGVTGGQRTFAVVYVPLALAQRAAGRPGAVNELLLDAPQGANPARVAQAASAAVRAALPGVGVTATLAAQEDAHRILYRDARNDRALFMVFAVLVLGSAAVAAFNLIARVVESQRREIGIGMALGVPPARLALRPLLLGLQIGVLGALLGVGATFALSAWIAGAVKELLPLPAYASSFDVSLFAQGTAVALLLPLAAAALPVWRGVRMRPIEAIRTGFRAAKGGGLAPALRRLPVPGGAVAQMPLRNLARNPRRTLMTVFGLAGAVVAVAAILGMVDSLQGSVDGMARETLHRSPDRATVAFDRVYPVASPRAPLRALGAAPAVGRVEPQLALAGRLRAGPRSVDVQLTLADPRSAIWTPTLEAGRFAPGGGIVIAQRAAENLGVGVGDAILLRHPRRTVRGFDLVETPVRVAGIHASPLRTSAYLPAGRAGALGLAGLANAAVVTPAAGVETTQLQRALFGRPGIAAVEPVRGASEGLRRTIDAFLGAIRITVVIALALATMIAFNSTSVAVDERLREHATMQAFGLPPVAGVRVAIAESVVVGALATALGLAGGLALTSWVVGSLLVDTFPDLGVATTLAGGSLGLAAAVGVGAAALTPLLMLRRLRRLDVPATLRVME
ncbi:MAG TPA: FtsX-like permease family protein [Conexibacter sp.]|nr:FtsX-like permease family protein [Conexibacter sp.]